jgi:chemotaxis response regulator CheB
MENIKEQILLKHLNNVEIDFIQDNYGNIFNAMDEYAEESNHKIYDLFNKPTIHLKPLEELYRKENQMKNKNGKIIFYTPDRTKFYKWITNKIINQ